ncbi:head-tail connector protein [Micromonospora sp. CA-246542]|uniref:head-tail connector protein n=1 Tax=Micromonospora sp. CA-246542 TaxID=3239959 RepID=UPI003D8AA1A0
MANEYTTLPLLKSYVGENTNTYDLFLQQCLTTASRSVESHCRRRFYADAAATARTYRLADRLVCDPDGDLIIVDDISSLTDLTVEKQSGSSWNAVPDYSSEPENALAISRPITYLRRPGGLWSTPMDTRIRVTAKWGWPAVPDEVVQATLLQAARLFKRKDSVGGTVGNEEFGFLRITRVDPDVQALLRPFVIQAVG